MKRFSSVYEAFSDIALQYGDKVALIYLGEKFSYRRLKELSDRISSSFLKIGVKRGDKVILYIPNCPSGSLHGWVCKR